MKTKNSLLRFSSVLLLLVSIVYGASSQQGKTIEKKFQVSGGTLVEIENTFGVIQITSWDNPVVDIQVEVEVRSYSDTRESRMLDAIEVDFIESSNRVGAKTDVDINTKGDESFRINYEVKVPRRNKLKVANSFGDIFIDDREGEVELKLAYGDLKIGNLAKGGDLKISFGEGEVGDFGSGSIDLRYCEYFSIESAGELTLDKQFSDVELGDVKALDLDSRYGQLEIAEVGSLNGDVDFSAVSIEKLTDVLKVDCKYSSDFTIEEVSKDFKIIDIRGEFGSYRIDLEEGLSGTFYGDFDYADLRTMGVDIDYSLKRKEDNHNEYEGRIGNGNGGEIRIVSQYGGLRLSQ